MKLTCFFLILLAYYGQGFDSILRKNHNGAPSDQLLVLDLKKQGMDCISSSPLPVPISLRGHLHPYLGRFLACSSGNFSCWLYSPHTATGDWEKISMASAYSEDITVIGASLNIPDKGIYFFASNNTDNSSTGFLLQFRLEFHTRAHF